ncbi:MAG: GNAT family acetyltransferase [Lachnospiraceae bacterium]|nr:GNAT family acetyltransferase [Lachnospiraceae bacterium]
MLVKKDILSLEFYKKSAFTGSLGNMRYRIVKDVTGEGDDTITKLKVAIWPGPFAYDKTDASQMTYQLFDFSDEGLEQITTWLNDNASNY